MPAMTDVEVNAELTADNSHIYRRVDIYEEDGITPYLLDVPFTGGSISGDATSGDVRRSIAFTFGNDDGALDYHPNGFWYDKIIKPYRGFRIWEQGPTKPATIYEWQQGEFMVDSIKNLSFPREQIQVAGRDYVKKMTQSHLARTEIFTAGLSVDEVVSDFALNSGVDKIIPVNTGLTLDIDYTFEADTARWDCIKTLAKNFAMDAFFDQNGWFHFEPFQDPALSPTVYTFQTGRTGTIISFDKAADDLRIFNHIIVSGGSTNVITITAEAINTDPASTLSVDSIGDRTYRYESALIASEEQAQSVADMLLAQNMLQEYTVNLSTTVVPWLEPGEVIKFLDPAPYRDQPERFFMASFTIPFTLDPMTVQARRVESSAQ